MVRNSIEKASLIGVGIGATEQVVEQFTELDFFPEEWIIGFSFAIFLASSFSRMIKP